MKIKFIHILAISLLNLISKTWRIEVIGNIPQMPAIIVFWHGLMLPVWRFFSGFKPNALVSMSKDGELLSRLLNKWNYNITRGSSSGGGKKALEQMITQSRSNYFLLTPDGPKGPQNKMKPGAVIASQRSETKLILCGVVINRPYQLKKSWDNFSIPLPFTKIWLNFSEEIFVPQNSSHNEISEMIAHLNNRLNGLSGIKGRYD